MDFNIETKISQFIQNQFPQFYLEDGPNFILFVKTYYEWLEQESNVTHESRKLLSYRDIDATLEDFLEHFQKKYLYSIPFDVIINKRYLLKHILDVYRSKSSIQGYKLLFRLIYNEDVEVYLPGRDVLRPSDGTWKEPRYIEVSTNQDLSSYIGKEITGVYSGTIAVVENFVKEYYDNIEVSIIYISNIRPKSGDFEIGEKIVLTEDVADVDVIQAAPTVLGSLDSISVTNGGQNFGIGDIIKVVHKDPSNNAIVSHGKEGLLKVSSLARGFGSLYFTIESLGFGYTTNALSWVYRNDSTGNGASFAIGNIINTASVIYNTDILVNYLDTTLDAATYGLSGNTSANLSSNLNVSLSYSNNIFGSIGSLTSIRTGNGYTAVTNNFVRSTLLSKTLTGNIVYFTTSNTITGNGTTFTNMFTNNSVICIQANSSLANTIEYHIVKTVTNSTSMVLYGPPSKNSTASAIHKIAPTILPANFAPYNPIMYNNENQTFGENEYILGSPSQGNNIVNSAIAINSGKGYLDGERVRLYLYGAVSNTVTILESGTNYSNGDLVLFVSDEVGTYANAYVTTNSNGDITAVNFTYLGSGYTEIPTVRVKSQTGTGAVIKAALTEYNTQSEITGVVNKKGIGKSKGYWSTTRGFLNSDKYIHDSYYYQDFSYELKVAKPIQQYRDILYKTFHTSGTELFGQYALNAVESSEMEILYENTSANIG